MSFKQLLTNKKVLFSFTFLFTTLSSNSYSQDIINNNFQSELLKNQSQIIECAAYFNIMSDYLKLSPKAKHMQGSKKYYNMSVHLLSAVVSINLLTKQTEHETIKMSKDISSNLKAEAGFQYHNLRSVMNRLSTKCINIYQNTSEFALGAKH